MNMLVNVLLLVTLLVVLPPNTEAASLSASYSVTQSQSPSFSGSGSGSWTSSQSYSGTAAMTLTATHSSSLSFGTLQPSASLSYTTSMSFGAVPVGLYRFENHCPLQSTAVCPFWLPHVFASYRMTVMNSSGFMVTYDNIVVPPGETPQFPLSYESTNGFIVPGGTYRFQMFGCTSASSCVEAWVPLVVTLNPRRKPVCDPNYLCRVNCRLVGPGLVECTWVNSNIVRLKRAILKVTNCYSINTFVRIALPYRDRRRTATVRNPQPQPTSIRLQLPTAALCHVQLIARYHPLNPNNRVFRYYFFT